MPKKIVIIANQGFSLINFRESLIKSLIGRGHAVYTLCPNLKSDEIKQIESMGAIPIQYKLDRTGISPIGDLLTLLSLIIIIKKIKPDVTFSYFAKPVIYGSIASGYSKVKTVIAMIEGLGYAFSSDARRSYKGRVLRFIMTKLYAKALKKVSHVVFLNKDDLKDFVDYKIIEKDKCKMLGAIGVDLEYLKYTHPNTETITFLMASRMLKEKGVLEFIEAAKLIKNKYPHVKFILAGSTDDNPNSINESVLTRFNSSGIGEWVGHVNIVPLLRITSIFVLPSYYREGVPRSIQEAQACGLATITTDNPGCRDTVIDGYNGLLIPTKDHHALSKAMEFFILNKCKIKEFGINARNYAENNFNNKKFDTELIKIIEQ